MEGLKEWQLTEDIQTLINNGGEAYGWGNHADAGYATEAYVDNAVQGNIFSIGRFLFRTDLNLNNGDLVPLESEDLFGNEAMFGDPIGRIGVTQNGDRKSTRLNSSHVAISYAVFC